MSAVALQLIYLSGVTFFALKGARWSRKLADGASGSPLPLVWCEILVSICTALWPLVLLAGFLLPFGRWVFISTPRRHTAMSTDYSDDPNEAYELGPITVEGPPADWLTVTRNGVPVRHFSPQKRALAERYISDPAFRAEIRASETKLHERGRKR